MSLAVRTWIAIAGALTAPTVAAAQPTPSAVVVLRLRVVDTVGAPVAGAEVTVRHGLEAPVAQGVTDSLGTRAFRATMKLGDYDVAARRIGYRRADYFFTVTRDDTLILTLVAPRLAQQLAAVEVRERDDVKRRRLYIDADAIAENKQPLRDAVDVVAKLRPDMIYGLQGARTPRCQALTNIWVNGKWILHPQLDLAIAAERDAAVRQANDLRPTYWRGRRRAPVPLRGRNAVPLDVASVLASIHLEHIAEMTYHGCDDQSIQKSGATSALFVVLKDGVAYSPDSGSYLVKMPQRVATRADTPGGLAAATIARIIGVYDLASGAAVDGVQIVDLATGDRVSTSTTGTANLAFLGAGEHRVRIERTGYRSEEIAVTLSPRDTVPITHLLARAP